MLSIPCNHPDVEEFIGLKADLDKMTKANISVRVTDEFMEAVKNDAKFMLSFNVEATGEVIEKEVDAKTVFKKLCDMNWDYAEPGILFWDRIEKWNLLSETPEFKFAGTNPCLTGDTLIRTTEGVFQIKDLVGKTPDVYCMDEASGKLIIAPSSKIWQTRKDAELVKVITGEGEIRCTPNHKIFTRNRGWVEASELKQGDKLTGFNMQMKDEKHVAVGLSGDGYVPEHRFVAGYYNEIEGMDVHHKDGNTLNNSIANLEVLPHAVHSKVTNTGRKIDVIRNAKGQYEKKETQKKRESFNLNKQVGTNWIVSSVEFLSEKEDVYDMTIPIYHNFIANDIVVHNCAEEPLPAGGSCLLGALNLAEFVTNGAFNIREFKEAVFTAVEALNIVLDEGLPMHPLEEQKESVRDWRQIGLGIMGLADMLIKVGIRYGSPEAIECCDTVARVMAETAFAASIKLGEKYGSYPKFNAENVMASDFYKKNLSHIAVPALRNSQLLTIAPTGSTSTMFGVSGGMEPIFANTYTRKTESLHGEDRYYEVFTPIVQKYFEENVLDPVESNLPDYFVTASDLQYTDRIDMQAIWQRYIDASISSTVNVPTEFTKEDVANLYMYAHEKGLKGVTVYRNGCKRNGILTTDAPENPAEQLKRGQIIPAGNHIVGKKRTLQTGCGTLHCLAFFDEDSGELMETYLSKGSTGGCNNFMIGLSRMISLSARGGISVYDIMDQLKSCGSCPSYAVRSATKKDTSVGSSCPVAIGNALLSMYQEVHEEKAEEKQVDDTDYYTCPMCGTKQPVEGKCNTCRACGFSNCG